MRRRFGTALLLAALAGCASNSETTLPPYLMPEEAPNSSDLSQLNVQMGLEYLRLGKDEVALNKFLKALAVNPQNAEAHGSIAILYERLGDTARAGQHYAESARYAPEDAALQNNYGSFLCRQDHGAEAQEHFQRALQNPLYKSPELIYTNAGICAMRYKDFDKAEEYFRKALEKDSQFPAALYQLGELNYNKGRYVEVRAYLRRYLDIAPHTPQTLWLGIRAERKLGDKNAESAYIMLLRTKFPEARETQLLYKDSGSS